jgi:hypothetical protein
MTYRGILKLALHKNANTPIGLSGTGINRGGSSGFTFGQGSMASPGSTPVQGKGLIQWRENPNRLKTNLPYLGNNTGKTTTGYGTSTHDVGDASNPYRVNKSTPKSFTNTGGGGFVPTDVAQKQQSQRDAAAKQRSEQAAANKANQAEAAKQRAAAQTEANKQRQAAQEAKDQAERNANGGLTNNELKDFENKGGKGQVGSGTNGNPATTSSAEQQRQAEELKRQQDEAAAQQAREKAAIEKQKEEARKQREESTRTPVTPQQPSQPEQVEDPELQRLRDQALGLSARGDRFSADRAFRIAQGSNVGNRQGAPSVNASSVVSASPTTNTNSTMPTQTVKATPAKPDFSKGFTMNDLRNAGIPVFGGYNSRSGGGSGSGTNYARTQTGSSYRI